VSQRFVPILLAAVMSLWLGTTLAPPILGDDAAITLRYAERLGTGRGFTYNDFERVCGTSSPLWTLMIGAARALGAPVEEAARGLTLVLFACAGAMCAAAAQRIGGTVAAWATAILIPADVFVRTQMLSGLEVPLEIALGLAAVVAAGADRETRAGVLLGLAMLTKLDALAIAGAIVIAGRAHLGRVPWRSLLIAATIALPWFVFAAIYFGSPLPQSVIVKLEDGRTAGPGPLWIARFFTTDRRYVYWLCAATLLWTLRRAPGPRRFVATALGLWLAAHTFAYSAISLGNAYPWYLVTPATLIVVLAASAAGCVAAATAIAAVAAAAVVVGAPHWAETLRQLRDRPIQSWEAFDADRRLAGIYVDQFAATQEVVQSAFGWTAFECRRPFIDSSRLNSRVHRDPDYIVVHGVPWNTGSNAPPAPEGYVALARFDLAAHLYPGMSWFVVFGKPDSAIARVRPPRDSVDVQRLHDARLAAAVNRAFRAGTPAGRAGR